jgi:hypothetical protein
VAEAKSGIGAWLDFYNEERQHVGEGEHFPVFRACSGSGGSAAGRQRRSSTYPQAFLVNLPRRAVVEALVPTGATAQDGFDIDEGEGTIAAPASAMTATGADLETGRATP